MLNRNAAVVLIVGLVLLSGCVEMTTTTRVGADGTIEQMEMRMEVDELAYDLIESEAQAEGYTSVEEMLEADAREDVEDEHVGDVSASTEVLGDERYLLTVTAADVDPEGLDGIDVTVENGTVRYEETDWSDDEFDDEFDDEWSDDEFDDEWFDDEFEDEWFDDEFEDDWSDDEFDDEWFGEYEFSFEYVLVMPGEIQDTNAHNVSDDGTTATWAFTADADTDDEFESMYAESTIDSDDGSDEGAAADDADDDADDTVPGFGFGVSVAALVSILVGLGFTRRRG